MLRFLEFRKKKKSDVVKPKDLLFKSTYPLSDKEVWRTRTVLENQKKERPKLV